MWNISRLRQNMGVECGADSHSQRLEHSLCKIIGLASNYWTSTPFFAQTVSQVFQGFSLLTRFLLQ